MNKKALQSYAEIAQSIGLRADENSGTIYGSRNDFEILIYPTAPERVFQLEIHISAASHGIALTKEEIKSFCGSNKYILNLKQNGSLITLYLKNITNIQKLKENISSCLNALLNLLTAKGYENCCEDCGKTGLTKGYYIAGTRKLLCPECYENRCRNASLYANQKASKKENLIGGIVGAFLGSLIGVVCIVILSQLGYVAALSGIVMAVCTIKGYEMLGGKLNTRGIIITSVIMLLMVYVGDRVDWAIRIASELEWDIFTSFRAVSYLIEMEAIELGGYIANLVLLYIFTILGAVPSIISSVKNEKMETQFGEIG